MEADVIIVQNYSLAIASPLPPTDVLNNRNYFVERHDKLSKNIMNNVDVTFACSQVMLAEIASLRENDSKSVLYRRRGLLIIREVNVCVINTRQSSHSEFPVDCPSCLFDRDDQVREQQRKRDRKTARV